MKDSYLGTINNISRNIETASIRILSLDEDISISTLDIGTKSSIIYSFSGITTIVRLGVSVYVSGTKQYIRHSDKVHAVLLSEQNFLDIYYMPLIDILKKIAFAHKNNIVYLKNIDAVTEVHLDNDKESIDGFLQNICHRKGSKG